MDAILPFGKGEMKGKILPFLDKVRRGKGAKLSFCQGRSSGLNFSFYKEEQGSNTALAF